MGQTGVRDARDYSTIVATWTKTSRPQHLLHDRVCMNARPIRPHTITTYRATVLRVLAHRALPKASRC
jgi:hypothetical protein